MVNMPTLIILLNVCEAFQPNISFKSMSTFPRKEFFPRRSPTFGVLNIQCEVSILSMIFQRKFQNCHMVTVPLLYKWTHKNNYLCSVRRHPSPFVWYYCLGFVHCNSQKSKVKRKLCLLQFEMVNTEELIIYLIKCV